LKKKKKETSTEKLGRFITECKHGTMLFSALVSSGNSDVVHIDIVPLGDNWKEVFKEELLDAWNCIDEWFRYDRENYYMMMFALERIKRKFRIDFDKDEDSFDNENVSKILN